MEQRPSNRIQAPGKPGAALVAQLEKLRDSHRLGLHMWENRMPYSFPEASHQTLNAWSAKPTAAHPQLSFSLLPAKDDGLTMQPYGQVRGDFNEVGYLLDLNEDQPTPPRYEAAHVATLESGENAYDKHYRPEYAGVPLDALAADYITHHQPIHNQPGVGRFNEIIGEVGHPHVAAIVAPFFPDSASPLDQYDALVTLSGCLSALEHAKQGADLPLVAYHVTGEHKGEITYLGQGKEQLQKLAVQSLKTIMDSPRSLKLLGINYGCMELESILAEDFGIDPFKPAVEQREAFAKFGVDVRSRGRE